MSISAIDVRIQFRGLIRGVIEGPVVEKLDLETPSGDGPARQPGPAAGRARPE